MWRRPQGLTLFIGEITILLCWCFGQSLALHGFYSWHHHARDLAVISLFLCTASLLSSKGSPLPFPYFPLGKNWTDLTISNHCQKSIITATHFILPVCGSRQLEIHNKDPIRRDDTQCWCQSREGELESSCRFQFSARHPRISPIILSFISNW